MILEWGLSIRIIWLKSDSWSKRCYHSWSVYQFGLAQGYPVLRKKVMVTSWICWIYWCCYVISLMISWYEKPTLILNQRLDPMSYLALIDSFCFPAIHLQVVANPLLRVRAKGLVMHGLPKGENPRYQIWRIICTKNERLQSFDGKYWPIYGVMTSLSSWVVSEIDLKRKNQHPLTDPLD